MSKKSKKAKELMKAVLAPEPDQTLIEKLKSEYKALPEEEEEEYGLLYQMFYRLRFWKPVINIQKLVIYQTGKPNVPPYGPGLAASTPPETKDPEATE